MEKLPANLAFVNKREMADKINEIIDYIENNKKFYDASNDWREINHISKEMYDKIIETQSCKPASKLDEARDKLEKEWIKCPFVDLFENEGCVYNDGNGYCEFEIAGGNSDSYCRNCIEKIYYNKYEQAIKIDDKIKLNKKQIEWLEHMRNNVDEKEYSRGMADDILKQLGLEE